MAQKLPNELIKEILAPVLVIHDWLFTSASTHSPFASVSQSSATYLEVCKAWSLVGTPLLYRVVIIRSSAQAQALERSFCRNPELGRLVKKLRVEGGFGAPMGAILRATPYIVDLWLTIDLPSTPTVSGLCSSLLNVNPRRVILQNHTDRSNGPIRNLVDRLAECFETWSNMTIIHLPWVFDSSASEDISLALLKSTALEIIELPITLNHIPLYLYRLAAIPSLKSIKIKHIRFILGDLEDPLKSLLLTPVHETRIKTVQRGEFTPKRSPEIISNSCWFSLDAACWVLPLTSASHQTQDMIWNRILYFAMDVPGGGNEDWHPSHVNAFRAKFCLVSRSFNRLAKPYLYGYPFFFTITSLVGFADCLEVSPELGSHVRFLLFCPVRCNTYDGEDGKALDLIFWDSPGLIRVCCLKPPYDLWDSHDNEYWFDNSEDDPPLFISWAGFEAMAAAPIVESRGLKICAPFEPPCPFILNAFTHLQSLEWDFAVEFTAELTNLSKRSMPNLEILSLTNPCSSLLNVLEHLDLPAIRKVRIQVGGYSFLIKHGHKISDFQSGPGYDSPSPSLSFFALCPQMTQLTINDSPSLRAALFKSTKPQICIATIRFLKMDVKKFKRLLAGFKLSFLPQLRQIQADSIVWPTTECLIAKDLWSKLADFL